MEANGRGAASGCVRAVCSMARRVGAGVRRVRPGVTLRPDPDRVSQIPTGSPDVYGLGWSDPRKKVDAGHFSRLRHMAYVEATIDDWRRDLFNDLSVSVPLGQL